MRATRTSRIERSRSRYLPLLWLVRQSGAAVEHNDFILTLGLLLSKQHVAHTPISHVSLNEGTAKTGGKFILNWRSIPASLIFTYFGISKRGNRKLQLRSHHVLYIWTTSQWYEMTDHLLFFLNSFAFERKHI